MYYGKMGFTYTELYYMPVFQRRYYYDKLSQTLKKEHEAQEQAIKKGRR